MSPEQLLQDQAELLSMLRTHAALPAPLFEARFVAPLQRVAEYVNTLPGSASQVFSGAGGLFRAALETSFALFRASDGRIFTGDKGVEDRHLLEVRWRYVCFLAGLLYPLGKPLEGLTVVDGSGRKWAVELEGLFPWATEAKVDRYYATWSQADAQPGPSSLTATFALKVVGRENFEWLNAASPELVQGLLDIVSGAPVGTGTFAGALVREMWDAVAKRERSRLPQNYGQLTVGNDPTPYLIDAIVTLFRAPWVLNEKVAFADADGIYLQWPEAGKDIVDFCSAKGYPGIPASDGALLQMLTAARIVTIGDGGVALTEIADREGEIVAAVKLARPGLVLRSDETLASVAARRPVAMTGVMAADPLSKPAAKPRGEQKEAPRLEAMDPSAVLGGEEDAAAAAQRPPEEDVADDEDGEDADTPQQAKPAQGATRSEKKKQDGERPPRAEPPGAKSEGAEIRFRDLLPKDIAEALAVHDSEYLGRIVHTWRKKENGSLIMRLSENGAAFDMLLLKDVCRDPSRFLQALAEKGFLYTNPTTPRKLVYKVPVTEGSQASKECFVIAHHAARKLGLQ